MKNSRVKSISAIILLSFCLSYLAACGSSESIPYSSSENWAYYAKGTEKDVDLFIVCPTVDMGTEDRFNMSMSDEETKASFVGALNMELGIYDQDCRVFAPYYRQMTISAYKQKDDQAALDLAYQDVKAAFLYYYENENKGRPFVLAGFSQGSQLGIMLMQDLFDDTKYSKNMVAAYMIGWRITDDTLADSPWLKMASGETDTGCIISFDSEAPEITSSFVVPAGTKTLAINPLNWKTDSTPADASLNEGACFTDYSGNITSEKAALTGAYLDETRGTLKVPDVSAADYPPVLDIFASGEYHLYDYQFFYRNLQKNVSTRINAYKS